MKKLLGQARLAAFEAAQREVHARYARLAAKLADDRAAELRELDRLYWAGSDFSDMAKAA